MLCAEAIHTQNTEHRFNGKLRTKDTEYVGETKRAKNTQT